MVQVSNALLVALCSTDAAAIENHTHLLPHHALQLIAPSVHLSF